MLRRPPSRNPSGCARRRPPAPHRLPPTEHAWLSPAGMIARTDRCVPRLSGRLCRIFRRLVVSCLSDFLQGADRTAGYSRPSDNTRPVDRAKNRKENRMPSFIRNPQDFWTGLIFLAIALAAVVIG